MKGRMLASIVFACVAVSSASGNVTSQPTVTTQPALLPVVITHPARTVLTPVRVPVLPVLPVVPAAPVLVPRGEVATGDAPGARLQPVALSAPTPKQVARLRRRWLSIVASVHGESRDVPVMQAFMELRPTPADLDVLLGPGDHGAMRRRLENVFNAEMLYQVRKTILRRKYTDAVAVLMPDYHFQGAMLAVTVPLYSVVLGRQNAPVRALQTRIRTFVFVNGHWVLIGR